MTETKIEMPNGFFMEFDSNTIDHLGIKLYSQFPPVLAELVSNAYDAEASKVDIIINRDLNKITVRDNGVGMTHDEINEAYLRIGRNRRIATGTDKSKNGKRAVTGKKGLGKLAIFGIAKTITISSVSDGYKNSLKLNYDKLKVSVPPYQPEVILEYEKCDESTGTEIIIEDFSISITDTDKLLIGLAKRFNFFDSEFQVLISDGTAEPVNVTRSIYTDTIKNQFKWEFPKDFVNEINDKVAFQYLNKKGIIGQIFTASTPLRKMDQGFNIYARGKIAAQNIFFNERSNDNFNQYVYGYFDIDFIDKSDNEDLIGTARQSILWEQNEEIKQIREYLDELVKTIGNEWRKKRAETKETVLDNIIPEDFFVGLSKSDVSQIKKIKNSLLTNSINDENVEPILEILNTVKDLYGFRSFQEYISGLSESEITIENIEKISEDWEQIEAKELAKIATGRISAINQFEKFIREDASETKAIQPFLEKFPWILNPRITSFEREKTFKTLLKENFPDEKLEGKNRRLDFLCYLTNGELVIIELKRPGIKISQKEINQALEYKEFVENKHRDAINNGISTFLISDNYELHKDAKRIYPALEASGDLRILSYSDLLIQAKKYNEEFIKIYEELEEKLKK